MFVVQICCHNSNITVATFRHKKKNWYFPYIFMLMFTLPRHKWLCHHVITQTCMLSCRLCGLGIVFMNLIKLLRRLRALGDLTFFRRWRLRLSHQLLLSSCGITFDLIVFSCPGSLYNRGSQLLNVSQWSQNPSLFPAVQADGRKWKKPKKEKVLLSLCASNFIPKPSLFCPPCCWASMTRKVKEREPGIEVVAHLVVSLLVNKFFSFLH